MDDKDSLILKFAELLTFLVPRYQTKVKVIEIYLKNGADYKYSRFRLLGTHRTWAFWSKAADSIK